MDASPNVSIVIVYYHTPDLVMPCVEALRHDLKAAGLRAQWLLVDNGSRPEDRPTFERLGLQRIDPGANVGYAGGVNRGIGASTADRLVIMNPDVLVHPGCLPALLEALDEGYAAAGPRFYWNEGRRLLLPPNEPRRRLWELRGSLALGSSFWARRARRAWRLHARRHWSAQGSFPTFELSGAMLAIRRDAWERVGPFDEGFQLYFEETDWLHRLRRGGGTAAYVAGAEAVHLYDQSARREPRAAAWFAQSRRRFQEGHYGPWFARLTEVLEARWSRGMAAPEPPPPVSEPPSIFLPAAVGPLWVEVSPRSVGFPAAAELLVEGTAAWQLPPEVWSRLTPGIYWLRVVDSTGRELSCEAFARG